MLFYVQEMLMCQKNYIKIIQLYVNIFNILLNSFLNTINDSFTCMLPSTMLPYQKTNMSFTVARQSKIFKTFFIIHDANPSVR